MLASRPRSLSQAGQPPAARLPSVSRPPWHSFFRTRSWSTRSASPPSSTPRCPSTSISARSGDLRKALEVLRNPPSSVHRHFHCSVMLMLSYPLQVQGVHADPRRELRHRECQRQEVRGRLRQLGQRRTGDARLHAGEARRLAYFFLFGRFFYRFFTQNRCMLRDFC